jgi:acyl-CoA reductase-like NAD-dependent aldehyde dehydrogenase
MKGTEAHPPGSTARWKRSIVRWKREAAVVTAVLAGSLLQPTVPTGVTAAGMRIAQEELFAPVIVVIRARSLDEAFDAADATDFGLTAAVFHTQPGHRLRFRRPRRCRCRGR